MRQLIHNKKGALTDLFLWISVCFILSIFSVIMFFAATRTYTELIAKAPQLQKALGNDGNATEIINSTFGQVPNSYQALKWITVMLIFGFALTIILTSFLVKTNPIFFVPYLIIYIIAIIISVPMSNTYEVIYQNPLLAASFSGFWGQNWIFLNLPFWIIVIGGLSGTLLFINSVRN